MSGYLLVETRDPFDSADCERFWELAEGLADQQHVVTVYLGPDSTTMSRRSSSSGYRFTSYPRTPRSAASQRASWSTG